MAKRTAGGRPTTFRMQYVETARKLAERGATTQEIADFLEVSVPTMYVWRNKYPEFLEAFKIGNYEHVSGRVERSFYERCIGYTIEAETLTETKPDGSKVTTKSLRHVPADVRAAMHWLRMRHPAWKEDVHRLELSIEDNRTPDEMRIALIDRLAAMLGGGSPLIEGTTAHVEPASEEDRDE